jgi:hypothetical protein
MLSDHRPDLGPVFLVRILKGDDLLGVMMIYHLQGVRPFTDKQIALVETFADQAAIAIENVRLFQVSCPPQVLGSERTLNEPCVTASYRPQRERVAFGAVDFASHKNFPLRESFGCLASSVT